MSKRWRLKKLVNWNIQGPIVIHLIVYFLGYNAAILSLLLVVYSVNGTLSTVEDHAVSMAPLTLWQQVAPVVICMSVMIPFMVCDLILLTNRIAGPLFRFETLLTNFSMTGKLKAAALRNGDLLTDYQRRFNDFVAVLHAHYPETQPASVAPVAEAAPAEIAIRKIDLVSAQL